MEFKTIKEETKKPGTPAGMNTEIVGTVSVQPKKMYVLTFII